MPGPRTDARRQRRDAIGDRRLVEHGCGDAESIAQFARPRVAKAGRADDQRVFDPSALDQFRQDQPGLDGLAEADGVGEQQPRRAADHGKRRFELIRPQTRSMRSPPSTSPRSAPRADDCRERGERSRPPRRGRRRSLRFANGRGRSNGSITRSRLPAFDRSRPSSVKQRAGVERAARGSASTSRRELQAVAPVSYREDMPPPLQPRGPSGIDRDSGRLLVGARSGARQFLRRRSWRGRRSFCATSRCGWR